MLDGCRVLDLSDEKGFLCGRILGDLGADVIKVEPPGGTPARNIGPFYHDIPHPEKSLYWFAYNANKRGITLNIETSDGREIFRKLARKADIVIESFKVGYLDSLGLDYHALAQACPRLILVSITPFGQTGPYQDYEISDIATAALGGDMYVTGDPDRAPLRISFPQAYLHAGATAAVAALIAYYHSRGTGEGQHVDVSICESMLSFSANIAPFAYMLQQNLRRYGAFREGTAGNALTRLLWPCKDGYILFSVMGGSAGDKSNQSLIKAMEKDGLAGPLKSFNWAGVDRRTATQETQTYAEEAIAPFFLNHTKAELLQLAIDERIMLLPVSTPADLLGSTQLKARGFWTDIDHPELDATITYPGAFVQSSEVNCAIRRRAPLIGEHNEEIYMGELGFTREEMTMMMEAGII
jgi:crotonobetainyl-CoA:carnitine CoA-transferase CaiB-like acyl-CoA transferase